MRPRLWARGRGRGRADARRALTRGACESPGLDRSSQGLTSMRGGTPFLNRALLARRGCLQRVAIPRDRLPPFSLSDAVVAGNPHLHRDP
jgi:hypothetical protein